MSSPSWPRFRTSRRPLLGGLLAVALARPAAATPEALEAAIRDFTGGTAPRPGGVSLDIPPLVENGNAVPVTISAESPMTAAEHVRAIGLFNTRNPLPQVLVAELGPWSGAARVATRIRLATTQRLVAVAAFSDGSFRFAEADVIVTLAACIEG